MIKHEFLADKGVPAVLPSIADRFVKAEVRHFEQNDLDDAPEWIRQG